MVTCCSEGHKGSRLLLQVSCHYQKEALGQNGAEPHGRSEEEERAGRGRRAKERERERLITCSLLRLKADGFPLMRTRRVEGGRQAAETSEPGGQAHITLEAGSDHLLFKGELRKHSRHSRLCVIFVSI